MPPTSREIPELELRSGRPAELDAPTMYHILQLRVDVFVVEQQCAYPELDGRDLEPDARWVWATSGGRLAATLRILSDTDTDTDTDTATATGAVSDGETGGPVARIGRVATAAGCRSGGVGARLLGYALAEIGPDRPVVLDAQSHLEGWYQRFGFCRDGEEFVEDGIAHVPMRRPAQAGTG